MDGYSVQDAASVLGVPEGRVWELLARGVLAGTPEGDSMRVFLKPDAPAASRPSPREALPRSNGNGESHGAEASAFRELLTEFRNLTERYGQALLALGEARGEVAGLRSRVELLEARIDLRLPARMDAEPVSWEAPVPRASAPGASAPEAPTPEPPAPAAVEAVLPAPAPVERTPRRRRPRSTRAAVAGFAEALARAQDPSVADVGVVPTLSEAGTEDPSVEAAPEVEPVAEPLISAEADVEVAASVEPPTPADTTYRAAEVEPDWFADGDFSWLDAADLEARSQTEVMAVAVGTSPVRMGFEAEPASEPRSNQAPEPDPIVEAQPPSEPQPVVMADSTAAPVPEAAPPAPVEIPQMEPVEVSGTGEEAVMWLGQAHEPADVMEIATAAPARTGPASPAADPRASITTAAAPPLAMTEEELAQLARDEGWDDAEVAAIRAMISRPSAGVVELPGSAELDEAMSALHAVPIPPRSAAAPDSQWAKPVATGEETGTRDDWAFQVEPSPLPAPAPQAALEPRRAAPDPDWLRRRRGPAASAYRRIRRIFTG